jgi:hypothetical protein
MRAIKPAATLDRIAIDEAIQAMREARRLLRAAGAMRAWKAAARALKSAEGARRHVRHRLRRSTT